MKPTISIVLDQRTLDQIDGLAATMQASRSWTISKLLDAALNPGAEHQRAAGAAGNPPPGIGPVAAGRGNHTGDTA
ncbi:MULTISPECIES: CopG family transcriptional regulator [unclassified Acidiphilium]|uniref:ribbon-helix-helix domain-containing protein n=1 Tax=unclassified Acidiphilium TaxID=2617493 RepID=UPI000BCDA8E2|nr:MULTISPECIES: CopG family transcriptional regulator [unclassified Acidiphilium]OYV57453.1 MAG: hypothetical protein B7Z76_01375 [Acidiphilium sp. 20-67-58]HQT59681.1 CopG family transcriptional regulator [Acidiphilium sp.]